MNLPKAKPTSRKFYGKWLYKVTLTLQGAGIFRDTPLQSVIDFCNETTNEYAVYSFRGRAASNRPMIKEVATFLQTFPDDLWSTRIESDQIDFYSNNKAFYDAVANTFTSEILHRFEPLGDTNDLLESAGTVVVKKLPHNKYQYRVYLLPHKMANDNEGKTKYIEWLKQQDRITCTPAIQEWFYKTNWNWDRRYVLVEDEQTLLMLKLRNSEVVGRVYKFVIPDK